MGVQFPGKKRYVTLEWPPTSRIESGKIVGGLPQYVLQYFYLKFVSTRYENK